MNRSESTRHNARLILQHVRGKSKAERKAIYDMLAAGPLGLMLHAISAIVAARKPITVNVFGASGDENIRAMARAGVRNSLATRG